MRTACLFLTHCGKSERNLFTVHSPRYRRRGYAPRSGSDGVGFTVSHVVPDYGDICQAITAPTDERPDHTDAFKTLNCCLDTASRRR